MQSQLCPPLVTSVEYDAEGTLCSGSGGYGESEALEYVRSVSSLVTHSSVPRRVGGVRTSSATVAQSDYCIGALASDAQEYFLPQLATHLTGLFAQDITEQAAKSCIVRWFDKYYVQSRSGVHFTLDNCLPQTQQRLSPKCMPLSSRRKVMEYLSSCGSVCWHCSKLAHFVCMCRPPCGLCVCVCACAHVQGPVKHVPCTYVMYGDGKQYAAVVLAVMTVQSPPSTISQPVQTYDTAFVQYFEQVDCGEYALPSCQRVQLNVEYGFTTTNLLTQPIRLVPDLTRCCDDKVVPPTAKTVRAKRKRRRPKARNTYEDSSNESSVTSSGSDDERGPSCDEDADLPWFFCVTVP